METPDSGDRYTKGEFYFFPANGLTFPANKESIMITSTLAQLHWYKTISPNFEKAISYALSTNFSAMETGKFPIDGENVMAIVNEYTTKPPSECDPESHRDYVDIQIMIAGAERFGYTPLDSQQATTPYRPEDDVAFYSILPEELNYITLQPGQFIIFFPSDIHQPEVFVGQPAFVRKVVLKVAVQPMANFSTTSVE
jgi:YhcH/YjgK/YiaL family protein